jgi:hypothetical protein
MRPGRRVLGRSAAARYGHGSPRGAPALSVGASNDCQPVTHRVVSERSVQPAGSTSSREPCGGSASVCMNARFDSLFMHQGPRPQPAVLVVCAAHFAGVRLRLLLRTHRPPHSGIPSESEGPCAHAARRELRHRSIPAHSQRLGLELRLTDNRGSKRSRRGPAGTHIPDVPLSRAPSVPHTRRLPGKPPL